MQGLHSLGRLLSGEMNRAIYAAQLVRAQIPLQDAAGGVHGLRRGLDKRSGQYNNRNKCDRQP